MTPPARRALPLPRQPRLRAAAPRPGPWSRWRGCSATRAPGRGELLARTAARSAPSSTTPSARGDVVVSVGGDGMLSSVAGLVSRAGGVLGVLPAGRGNDFARMLDLPTHARGAGRAVARRPDPAGRPARAATTGVVAGSVYAGVDARAAEIVDGARRLPGALQYPARRRPRRSRATGPAATGWSVDGDEREVVGGDGRGRELGVLRPGDADRPGRLARRRAARRRRDRGRLAARADAGAAERLRRQPRRARRGARPHRLAGRAARPRPARRSRSAATASRSACCPDRGEPAAAASRCAPARSPCWRRDADRVRTRAIPGFPGGRRSPMHKDGRVFPQLPPGFRFGTSTASYQIEGAASEDGKGPSIWDTFTAEPGRIADGSSGAVACDHYHRWRRGRRADARTSAPAATGSRSSWPRILPDRLRPGQREGPRRSTTGWSTRCSRPSVEPMVTLYHWDLPQALQDDGGWLNRDTIDRFADYAEHRRPRARRPGRRTGSRSTSPTS